MSDAHLFQTFVDVYDSLTDFKKVLEKIRKHRPDLLLIAGDMFDYRKTLRTYVRHYEGEGYTIGIRKLLQDFSKPIYAIRGNHEKEEILIGLDQTVENFHYAGEQWREIADCAFFFMNTRYETGWYSVDALKEISKKLSTESKRYKDRKTFLICHETLAVVQDAVPKEIVVSLRKSFHWILNGHMHYFDQKAYGLENVVSLPSLLPSRLAIGKYWNEQYNWDSGSEEAKITRREPPFGYVTLDTDDDKLELHRFDPSKRIVEIRIDVTDLNLQTTRERLRSNLHDLDSGTDREDLIVLPEVYGEMAFSTYFLKDVPEEYPDLRVEEIRSDKTQPKSVTIAGKPAAPPILTVESLMNEIENLSAAISARINRKVSSEIDEKTVRALIQSLLKPELVETPPDRLRSRLNALFDETLSVLMQNIGIEEPEGFRDNLLEFVAKVRR
ncbi:MAG: metallophosphoesterase [Candidatus Bathyarchaeota archaeon]|nr:metallophosphoesterase [Candidatus Bathyarchaeota archaeon]